MTELFAGKEYLEELDVKIASGLIVVT